MRTRHADAPTTTQQIVDFLHARITEEEESGWFAAETETKRLRIALLTAMVNNTTAPLLSSHGYLLLCMETLPYAWHPDYQEEWRP